MRKGVRFIGYLSAVLQKDFPPNHEGKAEISLMVGKVPKFTSSITLYYSETAGTLLFFESSNQAVCVCLSAYYMKKIHISVFFLHGATVPSGPGPPQCRGFTITHSDIPQSAGLLRTSHQPVSETSLPDNTHHSKETDIHAPGRIRTRNPSKRAAADHALDSTTGIGTLQYYTHEYRDYREIR
jgi:hypothetical protein